MSSKIKVDTIENVAGSGNVSLGSGHNLVVPGNLNVDTNLLDVDASNDTVGIGTTVNTRKLNINAGSYGHMLLDTADASHGIQILGQANAAANSGFDIQYAASTGLKIRTLAVKGISLQTSASASSPTEHLAIDTAGRVTMPNQPYFAAHMTGNSAYQVRTAGHVFDFNTTVYNVGSHFDTTNHRFTAPVNGKYLFTASFITNDGSPEGRITFYVNGANSVSSLQFGINGSNTGGGGGTNASSIIQLSASDYVDVRSQSGTTQFYEDNHSSFTGILLG